MKTSGTLEREVPQFIQTHDFVMSDEINKFLGYLDVGEN